MLRKPELWITLGFRKEILYLWITFLKITLKKNNIKIYKISQKFKLKLKFTLFFCSGLPVFDKRRERTWRDELDEYLGAKKEYTGDVFDYERLWSYIERISEQFVEEVSS